MTLQEMELKRVEEYIISKFSPLVKTFILNSPKINRIVEKYEKIIISFMDDNGKIDGKLLNELLVEKYPAIANWINIPQYNFYLKDEVEKIMSSLIK